MIERKKEMPVSVTALAPRVLRFIGSDESVDRVGDVVSVDGWNVKGYLNNPVVLFNHDYSKPVGKAQAVRINKRDKRLEFDVYFPTTEELSSDPKMPSEHALFIDTVYNMYKGGYLSAVSVGFKGEKAEPIPGSFGMKFLEQELLELSLVAVPANANALATAKSYGIHTELLGGVKMDTKEKSGARLSKTSRERLEKLAKELREFLDEDQGETEEEGCSKGDGIEEPQPETGGIMKPKAADIPVSKVLILGVSAPEDKNLR
jgi:HK97 family phage prohead protease